MDEEIVFVAYSDACASALQKRGDECMKFDKAWGVKAYEKLADKHVVIVLDRGDDDLRLARDVARRLRRLCAKVSFNLVAGNFLDDDDMYAAFKVMGPMTLREIRDIRELRTLLVTSGQFADSVQDMDYVVEGLFIQGFLYALTANTGGLKTGIALKLAMDIALGRAFGPHQCTKGLVLYFVGENDKDTAMRWRKMCELEGLHPDDVNVIFMPFVKKLSEADFQRQLVEELDTQTVTFLIVDTSAAYNEAEDENAAQEMLAHARSLREIMRIVPGGDKCAGLALCHPVKAALNSTDPAMMLPRGGGTFLNEIDGNAFSIMNETTRVARMGTTGIKWRGEKFEEMQFLAKVHRLKMARKNKTATDKEVPSFVKAEHAGLGCSSELDDTCKEFPVVVAEFLDEQGLARTKDKSDAVLREVALAMYDSPGASFEKLAQACKLNSRRSAQTFVETLAERGLAEKPRGSKSYRLTNEGEAWIGKGAF